MMMERMDVDVSVTETTAFVKNLLATVREVVGFLEGVQGGRRRWRWFRGG